MFVSGGAKELIRKKSKERFVNETLRSLMAEAKKLGLTKKDVISIIEEMEE